MERLTRRMCGGWGMVEGYELSTLRGMKAAVDKLAAYENSGISPELAAVAAYPGREAWVATSPDGRVFRIEHGKVCSVTFTMGACLRASAGVLFDGGDYVDTVDPDALCFTEEAARAACEKLKAWTDKELASWEAAMEAEQ